MVNGRINPKETMSRILYSYIHHANPDLQRQGHTSRRKTCSTVKSFRTFIKTCLIKINPPDRISSWSRVEKCVSCTQHMYPEILKIASQRYPTSGPWHSSYLTREILSDRLGMLLSIEDGRDENTDCLSHWNSTHLTPGGAINNQITNIAGKYINFKGL